MNSAFSLNEIGIFKVTTITKKNSNQRDNIYKPIFLFILVVRCIFVLLVLILKI